VKSLFPRSALDHHIAFVGKTGSGKTGSAKSGTVEPALAAGERVCVIDPTGAWWGLRLGIDGNSKGLPIYVFGGDHGDFPLLGTQGEMIAEAIQTRQDKDITALFASFDSSTGSNSGAITTTLFQSAITTLDSNNIPSLPRVAVLHPFQWGSLRVAFTNASTYGMQVGEDVVRRGVTASVLGVDIFTTGNVGTATVSTSTVYAGAMFHPSAVALATKGALPEIASEYDASLRAVEVVGTGVWGEAEYRGGATTNGRGGAAVFLYSNSTVA